MPKSFVILANKSINKLGHSDFPMHIRISPLLIIIVLTLSSFLLIGSPLQPKTAAQSCPIFHLTLSPAPTGLNMLTANSYSAFYLIGLQYLGLYPTPALNGQLQWSTAITDWINHNSNYTQWTFNVKPGLKWSNGQVVNASDILNTYSKNFAFNASYDFVNAASEVTSSSALNSSAAVFNLNTSDAHFAERISSLLFTVVYPQSVTSQGPSTNNLGTLVTDGPFYVSNYQAGQTQMVLKRNPYYTPLPNICEIDVNFVESFSQDSTYLLSGTTDLAQLVPNSAASVMKNPYIHLYDQKGFFIQTIEYNVTSYPYNMTAFRQALAYGINRTTIIQQAFNSYAASADPSGQGDVSPASSWYNPNVTQYNYDQNKSLQLLSSIGIAKGSDGFLQYPNGTDITIAIWATSSYTSDTIAADDVANSLNLLGFRTNLQITSASALVGDFYSNIDDIQHAMIIYTGGGTIFADPWLSAEPAWQVYWEPGLANSHWEYPPSADTEYYSNLTAVKNTDNLTLLHTYLNNIQSLNAQYLPTLALAYPDFLWAYNTQYWNNWTPGQILYQNIAWNYTAFADLLPASSTSTSANSTTSTTSSMSSSSTTSGFSSTSSTTSASSNSSGGIGLPTEAAIVIVVVVVIAGVGIYSMRRRGAKAPTPPS
jgi:ABC-type transport system substrate-binding protein